MKKKLWSLGFVGLLGILMVVESCKHDPIITDNIDEELYNMAKDTNGFTWFKFSDIGLPKSSGTGHSEPLLRTRYNDIATMYLDSNGLVIPGTQFPNGSLIVKELLSNSGGILRYAVLYKDSDNINADPNGWVWGYIDTDGTVAVTARDKGQVCIGCHTQSDNIDYGLMNKYFPL